MLVQAADAAEVRSSASITASSDANMKMEAALSAAEDVPTFAARRALNILQVLSVVGEGLQMASGEKAPAKPPV